MPTGDVRRWSKLHETLRHQGTIDFSIKLQSHTSARAQQTQEESHANQMSASTSTAQTATAKQHVPAWKRIGLKLKYAKDTAEPSAPPQERAVPTLPESDIEPSAPKRQRNENTESARTSKPAKKRKTHAQSSREDEPDSSKATSTSSTAVNASSTSEAFTAALPVRTPSEALLKDNSRQRNSATQR